QLAHVQAITLGPTLAPIDFNRGGIHHMVGDALRVQKAMEPEAVTTGFLATDDRCACRQTKASFGLSDFLEQARLVARGDSALTRLLTRPRSEAQLPGVFTQFKGHKQATLGCGTILIMGRCRGHGLSPPK